MIVEYSIIVFITQLVFIGCRTWNVRAIAQNNIMQVLVSGAVVHIAWLASIAIGSVSMIEIVNNFDLRFVPVLLCSLTGSLIGSYIGLMERKK